MSSVAPTTITRRAFTQRCASAALAATIPALASRAAARNPDPIKLGLVGCGSRGIGAVMDAIVSSPHVELHAVADVFPEPIAAALQRLRTPQKEKTRRDAAQYGNLITDWDRLDAIKVTPETCFTGFDACRQLLRTDVDVVILATPPGFRPLHIRATLEAGKHVFAEKPVAVDPAGVRSVLQSVELARAKHLGLMGGTQLRFHRAYREVMQRVHAGGIGDLVSGSCFWWADYYVNWKAQERAPGWSDMEYQLRCWPHFCWLSGDHLVENLVHNIDAMNWALGGPPKTAAGMGGHANWDDWKVRGNIYDHFYIEYVYPNGAHVAASSRQNRNCTSRIGELIHGTRGSADPARGLKGARPYEYSGPSDNPRNLQWAAYLASIRQREPLNHGRDVAESTMTAILGRMSAYTGRAMNYAWALHSSQLDLSPPSYAFGPLPEAPLPVPGKTPVI